MTLPTVNAVMRLGADPELRFTPSGQAVANFRLGSNGRKFNKSTNEWEDAGECWLNATVWGEYAENVAESLTKGMEVMVEGRLETRNYEDREGNKRTSLDLTVYSIGPTLKYATAKVTKTQKREASQQQQSQQAAVPEDPWAPPAGSEEPPF